MKSTTRRKQDEEVQEVIQAVQREWPKLVYSAEKVPQVWDMGCKRAEQLFDIEYLSWL